MASRLEAERILIESRYSGKDLYTFAETNAWQTLMPFVYYWFVDGKLLENTDLEGRLFRFSFDLFQQNVKDSYKMFGQQVALKDIAATYSQQIRAMFFERSAVEAWREVYQKPSDANSSENAADPQQQNEHCEISQQEVAPVQEIALECCTDKVQNQFSAILIEKEAKIVKLEKQVEAQDPIGKVTTPVATLISVNVPASSWAGKTAATVYSVLVDRGFAPAVIAFIIMEKVGGITKTDAGRLFYQDETSKGKIQDERTYQRKIDTLLVEAKDKYLFTFDE